MADPGKSAGAIEEATVGGDAGTVQLHGQGEEGRIVEGETELSPEAGGALQERRRRRGDGEREGLELVESVVEP
jgi:hypothetical protein